MSNIYWLVVGHVVIMRYMFNRYVFVACKIPPDVSIKCNCTMEWIVVVNRNDFYQVISREESCQFTSFGKKISCFLWIFTWGQFWLSGIVVACICVCLCVCVCQSLACPCNDSWPIQLRTKFLLWDHETWFTGISEALSGMCKISHPTQSLDQRCKTLVKLPVVLKGNRPWPSRSSLILSQVLPNSEIEVCLKYIFVSGNCCILSKMSLKFVPRNPNNIKPSLVQIMSGCWICDRSLFEQMMA